MQLLVLRIAQTPNSDEEKISTNGPPLMDITALWLETNVAAMWMTRVHRQGRWLKQLTMAQCA